MGDQRFVVRREGGKGGGGREGVKEGVRRVKEESGQKTYRGVETELAERANGLYKDRLV